MNKDKRLDRKNSNNVESENDTFRIYTFFVISLRHDYYSKNKYFNVLYEFKKKNKQ